MFRITYKSRTGIHYVLTSDPYAIMQVLLRNVNNTILEVI